MSKASAKKSAFRLVRVTYKLHTYKVLGHSKYEWDWPLPGDTPSFNSTIALPPLLDRNLAIAAFHPRRIGTKRCISEQCASQTARVTTPRLYNRLPTDRQAVDDDESQPGLRPCQTRFLKRHPSILVFECEKNQFVRSKIL